MTDDTLTAFALPRRPAALVFDMDGLIFDTETLYREAIFAAAAEAGRAMTPALFLSLIGNPWPRNRALLLAAFGEAFAVEAFRDEWVRYFEALALHRQFLKPGVVALLDRLDALGLPRAIATSSAHATAAHHLAAHGLAGRFHHIVAQGDYARGKPAPDPYLLAAARLGVAPALCLALEDSHNGVRSAAAAGMMTVMVPDLLEATDEISALCVGIAPDLHAVARLL
ncbi:HAD family hydrolase [Falsiroseomonas sp. E2-1-a20]|uniref:HAD family hydrolase n=1 Tax=Falsiroseomonas sp. E2-1-a20 TaxID=3239300 RepID=UPI003F2E99E0